MDGQRLQPELRCAVDDGRGARRQVRPQALVRRRRGVVHRGFGRLRARAKRRMAGRRPCRAGGRRRGGDAPCARAAERGVPRTAAGQGAGHFQRRGRARCARWPGRRRRGHPRPGLAVDLLAQHPDRGAARPAGASPDAGELWRAEQAGHRRSRARHCGRIPSRTSAVSRSSLRAHSVSSGGWCGPTPQAGQAWRWWPR